MIQLKTNMCSGQTCTGERVDKRCQLGRASSELLMAALFRFSFLLLISYYYSPWFSNSWHLLNLIYPQIVGVSREDEGRYDAFADNGLGVWSPKYPLNTSDIIDCFKKKFYAEYSSRRHQWPSMWFSLLILQGIFLQGSWTQMQMLPCHLVSRKALVVGIFASGIGCLILHHCIKSSCQSWQRIADKKNDSGSPAKLYCLAYGFPKPTVTWWKGTTMLPLSSERHRQEEFTLSLRWG